MRPGEGIWIIKLNISNLQRMKTKYITNLIPARRIAAER